MIDAKALDDFVIGEIHTHLSVVRLLKYRRDITHFPMFMRYYGTPETEDIYMFSNRRDGMYLCAVLEDDSVLEKGSTNAKENYRGIVR